MLPSKGRGPTLSVCLSPPWPSASAFSALILNFSFEVKPGTRPFTPFLCFHPSKGRFLCVRSLFSHIRLCAPIDCSPPGSSVHGTLQTRMLEWVAVPSSRGPSRPSV